jgi:DMSO reductase anchor subunit
MHPAPSVIFFTVVSGMGYGIAFFLGFGVLDPATVSAKAAHVVALAMISGGLLSSTLHLGNPQRAWRAFSQWRTSWLSREGIYAVATFLPLTINAALCLFLDSQSVIAGLLGSLGAVATVFSTAMIYASLRMIEAWHSRLTIACYLVFAGLGGSLWVLFFDLLAGGRAAGLLTAASLALMAAAWVLKTRWRTRMLRTPGSSTPETATGLGHLGKVNLLERPHATENYLIREMGFRIARKHASKLFNMHIILAYAMPLICILLALPGLTIASFVPWFAVLAGLAVAFHVAGMFVERWLFFAEARHAVMNYYGG